MTIAKSAMQGISWSAASTIFKGVVQLAQLVILARILSPIELGLLAMVNLVVGLAQIFGDAGISNATIYYRDLTRAQLNQLYTVNIAFGLFISVVVMLASYPIEAFYAMDNLAELLVLLAPVFFIRSLSQQHIALLQQQLKFNQLAKIEILASAIGFIGLLVFLFYGLKLEAVVFAQLVTAAVLSCVLLFFTKLESVSLKFPRWSETSRPIKYGLYQTGEAFINYLSAQFDQLLIGKLLGTEVLGIYSYVKALVFRPALQLINPIVNKVTFPLMVNYKESHSISSIYAQIIRFLSMVNVPLYLGMALYPASVLYIAYGDEWQQYGELLRWLALNMLIISLINPVGALLRATGEVRRGFVWNIFVTLIRPVVIVVSVSNGVVWLVKMLVILQAFLFILHWRFLISPVAKLAFGKLIKACLVPFAVLGVSALAVFVFDNQIQAMPSLLELLFVALAYCLLMFPFVQNTLKEIRK